MLTYLYFDHLSLSHVLGRWAIDHFTNKIYVQTLTLWAYFFTTRLD